MNTFAKLNINNLKVITNNLDPQFYYETLNRPWLRVKIFLEDGPLSRTPEHYKKFFYEWKVLTPTPVHYIPEPGNWKKLEDGRMKRIQNIPLKILYPEELHQGIWGGEGVIKGFQKRHKRNDPVAYYWTPSLKKTVVYSEILDKYFKVMVTPRALDLIDQHYGLDMYFMKTSPADLMSELCLKLKREMFYRLHHKTIYPDDSVKREEIYNKYKEFLIPEEEVDWYGMNLREAHRKQVNIDAEEAKIGPYKHIFRKELLEHLRIKALNPDTAEEDTKKGILDRLKSMQLFSK